MKVSAWPRWAQVVGALVLVCLFASGNIAASCGTDTGHKEKLITGDTTIREANQTEQNQTRLAQADPPPQFEQSQARKQIIRKLKEFNVPHKTGYISLWAMGHLVAYFVVDGMVQHCESYLTTPQQVVAFHKYGEHGNELDHVVVDSPDFDGTYGKNSDAIYFYDSNGIYHEWALGGGNGYLYTTSPQDFSSIKAYVNLTSATPTGGATPIPESVKAPPATPAPAGNP